jgi:two-component system copper resistance phosphate regulon response regulator CusR
MRILYVQGNRRLASSVEKAFRSQLFAVDTVDASGLSEFPPNRSCDAIVVDVNNSPDAGISLVRRLRANGVGKPIVVFNGCQASADRIRLLEAGADDCLVDPISLEELVVRTRVLLGRPSLPDRKMRVGELELDYANRQVTRSGKRIELKPKEFAIFEYLMRNAGRPVTRSMIVEHVWGGRFEGLTNVVDVHITHLRAKINRGFKTKLIRTVYGVGYELAEYDEKVA